MNTTKVVDVGSLPKARGRQALLKGNAASSKDIKYMQKVFRSADPDSNSELEQALAEFFDSKDRQAVIEANSKLNILMVQAIGLAYIYDGESFRPEMYASIAEHTDGLVKLDPQVSFFNLQGRANSFVPFMYESPLSIEGEEGIHEAEVKYIQSVATMLLKVPVTGAYTMGSWTDFGQLPQDYRSQGMPNSVARRRSLEDIAIEFSTDVINPTILNLDSLGVERIQIDEPAATDYEGNEDLLVKVTDNSTRGVKRAEVGVHLCFSRDYDGAARIASLPQIKFITVETANRDNPEHTAFTDVVNSFEREGYKGIYIIGVEDVHKDELASPELIAEQGIHVAKLVGLERVELAPDCGLRTRQPHIAFQKLQNIVAGAKLMDAYFGLS